MRNAILTLIGMTMMLISATTAALETVGTGCRLAWDWDGTEASIDGFKFYLNADAPVIVAKDKREVLCADLAINAGANAARVTAYNAAGESPPSNTLGFVFVTGVPAAPTVLRLVISP